MNAGCMGLTTRQRRRARKVARGPLRHCTITCEPGVRVGAFGAFRGFEHNVA